jgi:hypothetical protein
MPHLLGGTESQTRLGTPGPGHPCLAVVTMVMSMPLGSVYLVVVDLGEDQLLIDAKGVVAATVKTPGRKTTEVAHTWVWPAISSLSKNSHMRSPRKCDLGTDGVPLAQLERRDGLSWLSSLPAFGHLMTLKSLHRTFQERGLGPPPVPTPMLITIFSMRGHQHRVPQSEPASAERSHGVRWHSASVGAGARRGRAGLARGCL